MDLSEVGVTKRGLEGSARLRLAGIRQLKGSVGEGEGKVIEVYYLPYTPSALIPRHPALLARLAHLAVRCLALPGHSADAAQQLAGSPLDTLSPPLVLDTRAAAAGAVICVHTVASHAGAVGGAVV